MMMKKVKTKIKKQKNLVARDFLKIKMILNQIKQKNR